jgi:small acid-soluble spore protein (thioredoxin-like protein)
LTAVILKSSKIQHIFPLIKNTFSQNANSIPKKELIKVKHNPDNRKDNVDKIQKNIDMTIHNTELAEEMIVKTSDENMKKDLKEKNKRRQRALDGFKAEIKDEAEFQNKND